ncbi:MSE1 [Candida oxycetoniae]|uniref:Glutamate--tRNA ligase, mitochondrial n=1 Tax=Candida oxycetoniae TaxID=497107 RepID=A0AAI9SXD9_9ASCO|nr:MSE1 [Candida oxycetoniae]KAI3404861.2 MSE1 [Candida oxycetoniae]
MVASRGNEGVARDGGEGVARGGDEGVTRDGGENTQQEGAIYVNESMNPVLYKSASNVFKHATKCQFSGQRLFTVTSSQRLLTDASSQRLLTDASGCVSTDFPINSTKKLIHPTSPARTRFAPSPTGFLHLGSLRTALYNYLLAKNTGGQFILRIEDTDSSRLVQGAENNILDTLKWCNLDIDEGPEKGGPFGPYRQSQRKHIYQKYAQELLDRKLAYKCYCSKSRLDQLRESAKRLKPRTTVSYDRKCLNSPDYGEESYVIRFKSPNEYPTITDLLHGDLSLQPQYNLKDKRFDDFVILKNDGMPTYHFANVIDDHLMKITHVIRGEEWLSSTPKHIALYTAFGWEPPKFAHVPLLTSLEDKKLSKRKGDLNVIHLREQGILPQALLNFVALFGWSPPRELHQKLTEVFSLNQLIELFSLDQLTKGNAKVADSKLHFLQKEHFQLVCKDPKSVGKMIDEVYEEFQKIGAVKSKENLRAALVTLAPYITNVNELKDHAYLFKDLDYSNIDPPKRLSQAQKILESVIIDGTKGIVDRLVNNMGVPKKDVFEILRLSLSGGKKGVPVPKIIELLGEEECITRAKKMVDLLERVK